MTRTKSTFLALIAVLLSPMAANADLIEITGSVDSDGIWDITLVEGTYNDLAADLMDQEWWGDETLALLFANTLAELNVFFAFTDGTDPRVSPENYGLALWTDPSASLFQDAPDNRRLFATATKVPEPGTLALLGIGLFGMGLSRRRKKA